MQVVFLIHPEKYTKLREAVLVHELLSRQSLTFRDSASLGLKESNWYLLIEGSEEAIKAARDLLKEAKELTGPEAEKIIRAIKEQEERAEQGFGALFG